MERLDSADTARRLRALVQLEIDVVQAGEQARRRLRQPLLRDEADRIIIDDQRAALELSEVLRALGSQPPRYARDWRGMLMAGITAVHLAAGEDGSLRALAANARALARRLDQAMRADLPIEVRATIAGYLADQDRHRERLEALLAAGAGRQPRLRGD